MGIVTCKFLSPLIRCMGYRLWKKMTVWWWRWWIKVIKLLGRWSKDWERLGVFFFVTQSVFGLTCAHHGTKSLRLLPTSANPKVKTHGWPQYFFRSAGESNLRFRDGKPICPSRSPTILPLAIEKGYAITWKLGWKVKLNVTFHYMKDENALSFPTKLLNRSC